MMILGGKFKYKSIRTILLGSLFENDISDGGFELRYKYHMSSLCDIRRGI
jgi:hypothetical protein